jgi:hypothetical protein
MGLKIILLRSIPLFKRIKSIYHASVAPTFEIGRKVRRLLVIGHENRAQASMPLRQIVPDTGDVDVPKFNLNGFLAIRQLVDRPVVELLRRAYDDILSGAVICEGDRKLGGKVRQIMYPQRQHPVFADNAALDAGRAVARRLLGVAEPELGLQMLIYKEPGQLNETPWHQDFAYIGTPFTPAGVSIPHDIAVMFWLALDDVDQDNGCMHFVPGGHLKPLAQHHVAGGEPDDLSRLLAIDDPTQALELDRAVACPLPAGGATIHSAGTPHFTSGNRTADRPRRAYIFNFNRRPEAEQ